MNKSTITRERLEELAAGQSGFNLRIATHEESQELACMALAELQAEPVMTANKLGNSPVIPDGYVMVPKEPTQAMCAAFNDSDYGRKSLRERFVAMLAAAPQEVKP